MEQSKRLALAALLSAVLTVAACGGAGGGSDGAEHGGMDRDGSVGPEKTGRQAAGHAKEAGPGGAASGSSTVDGRYSDRRFIDAMVPHHQGAVDVAEVALQNAEHEEIRRLSEEIVAAQQAEIKELKDIRREEFGSAQVSMRMDMGQMDDMGMMTDPGDLANRDPFDRAFIDAMIPHHRSAVQMAGVAREKSRNPRIKGLAEKIVEAQEREISQMRSWREEWYPEG